MKTPLHYIHNVTLPNVSPLTVRFSDLFAMRVKILKNFREGKFREKNSVYVRCSRHVLIPITESAGSVNLQSARRRANRECPASLYHILFPCDNKFAPRAKITRLSVLPMQRNIKRILLRASYRTFKYTLLKPFFTLK